MPNIIINNYCNQQCSYCFAHENMKNIKLQKDMSILTYLKILKYLKINGDNNVRILGGEPLLSPNIRFFLKIANKGGFNIIIFSNININNSKFKEIFNGFKGIRINCNINNKDFYSKKEIINIEKNLNTLKKIGIKVIIGYNITQTNENPNFIFELAKKTGVKAINLKITNSILGGNLIIDNSSRKLGKYIFNIIKKYHNDYFIELSCGLNKSIFLKEELYFINNKTNINLKFGCDGNIGKFDINTNGSFFKCYPLEIFFNKKLNLNINYSLKNNIKIKDILRKFNKSLHSNGECSANKIIKGK